MRYGILLWPHANQRYQASAEQLSQSELNLLLNRCGMDIQSEVAQIAGTRWLTFETDDLSKRAIRVLSDHSLLYMLAELLPGGAFKPVCGRRAALLGSDLAGVLKYKGKTNELFTELLINAALYTSDFADADSRDIHLLDPMCGRGTTLFQGANRGFHVTGIDIDKKDIAESYNYFKRYLEYHKKKHSQRSQSLTRAGKQLTVLKSIEYFAGKSTANGAQTFRLACADGAWAADICKQNSVHLLVADLPYGVQHAPGAKGGRMATFEKALLQALPAWRRVLKVGGCVALAFNIYTIKRDWLVQALENAGLCVQPTDGFEHWVEQAVHRDIVVAKK